MLKFMNNNNAFLGLSWSQLGLLLVTGILLTAVFSVLFFNNWQRRDDLTTIASRFSTAMQTMDIQFFEDTSFYCFPEKNYPYEVSVSTEYLSITAQGMLNTVLSVKERFVIRPWIRLSDDEWISGEDLHRYLNETYGHFGVESDPINITILNNIFQDWNISNQSLAQHPYNIHLHESIFLDKVILFYEDGNQKEILLIYQRD